MNTHTDTEYKDARSKLPKPVADFLLSTTLSELYIGIGKKLNLNLRQIGSMSRIVNETLVGLEPEHGLEHNLHQELPELSNEKTRELAADINDRIFKEAQRRLRENIVSAETPWDEEALGSKETYAIPVSDSELEKRVKEEESQGGFHEPIVPKEILEKQAETDSKPDNQPLDIFDIPTEDLDTLTPEQITAKYGPVAGLSEPDNAPIRPATPIAVPVDTGPAFLKRSSVVSEKLATPTAVKQEISAPQALKDATPPLAPPPPASERKPDPYREIPE